MPARNNKIASGGMQASKHYYHSKKLFKGKENHVTDYERALYYNQVSLEQEHRQRQQLSNGLGKRKVITA